MSSKVYKHLIALDQNASSAYGISEEILMENAARGVYEFLVQKELQNKKTLIVTGGGNNGADGLALARMLPNVCVFALLEPKSELCKLQSKRAKNLGVRFDSAINGFDVIIDAVIGSGSAKPLEGETLRVIKEVNLQKAVKIAIDVPSGVRDGMGKEDEAFRADFTVTLGAHKESLYSDYAKDFTGEIALKDIGLPHEKYTQGFLPTAYLINKEDFSPPLRAKKNCHKGDFGHLCIVAGELVGASAIAAKAAIRSGVGLVTITARENIWLNDSQIMVQNSVPKAADTLLIGQGLGNAYTDEEVEGFVQNALACVLDADLFKKPSIKKILQLPAKTVLTPHPKEFCSLLKMAMDVELSVEELQKNRFGYAKVFSKEYPSKVLVLKGANTLIAYEENIFIMPHGSSALAKGGSGDALAGVIAALLAQGYEPSESAKQATLAVAIAAENYQGANYSMSIEDLIDGLRWL